MLHGGQVNIPVRHSSEVSSEERFEDLWHPLNVCSSHRRITLRWHWSSDQPSPMRLTLDLALLCLRLLMHICLAVQAVGSTRRTCATS
eukprot:6084027-Amphidinium_carterae.1